MDRPGARRGTLAELGEFGLIRHLADMLGEAGGRVETGIGDDCAVVRVGERAMLLATDSMVEGTHFLGPEGGGHPLRDLRSVGWRLAVSNLSDVAAMGGEPLAATASIAASPEWPTSALEQVYRGLREAADAYRLPVCGGDVVRTTGPTVLTLSILGEVAGGGQPVLRGGARPGDALCVTGCLGESRAAVRLTCGEVAPAEALVRRHLYPEPRLTEGALLRLAGATAMMDLSDGLSGDLPKLADASGVGFEVEFDDIPVSQALCAAATTVEDARHWALAGGEDYELLVALPPESLGRAQAALEEHSGLTPIGRLVEASEGRSLLGREQRVAWDAGLSWDHYLGDR
jgi:thiamine-monophosphate kinase